MFQNNTDPIPQDQWEYAEVDGKPQWRHKRQPEQEGAPDRVAACEPEQPQEALEDEPVARAIGGR